MRKNDQFKARDESEIIRDLDAVAARIDAAFPSLAADSRKFCDLGAELARALSRSGKAGSLFNRDLLAQQVARLVRDHIATSTAPLNLQRQLDRMYRAHDITTTPAA